MKQKLPSRKRKREVGADAAEAPHRQSIKAVSQPTRLGQAYLTFGTKPLHITCGKCGMQYTKLSREDDSLHAQYCKNVVGPILWHSTPHQTFYKTRSVTLLKKKETPQTSLQGYIIIVPYKEANKVVQAKVSSFHPPLGAVKHGLIPAFLQLQEIAARIDGVLNASPISNEDMEASTFYVMTKSHTVSSALKKQQVVGCAISRPIRTAYRAVAKSPTSVSSEDKQRNRLSPSDEVDSAVLCS